MYSLSRQGWWKQTLQKCHLISISVPLYCTWDKKIRMQFHFLSSLFLSNHKYIICWISIHNTKFTFSWIIIRTHLPYNLALCPHFLLPHLPAYHVLYTNPYISLTWNENITPTPDLSHAIELNNTYMWKMKREQIRITTSTNQLNWKARSSGGYRYIKTPKLCRTPSIPS